MACSNDTSLVLKEYLNGIAPEINYKQIAKAISCQNLDVLKFFSGEKIPPYSVLADILSYFELEECEIIKLAQKDALLMYHYWDYIYPNEVSIKELRIVIREMICELNKTIGDVAVKCETSVSYISAILSGDIVLSYNYVKKFANLFKMTPFELLEKNKGRNVVLKKRGDFSKLLIESREKNGWTIEDASGLCNLSIYRYLKIEEAEAILNVRALAKICKGMKINFEKLGRVAIEAKLLFDIEDFEKILNNKKYIRLTKSESEKYLEEELFDICKYKYVTINGTKHITSTIITLVFLILAGELKTKEKYKNEIIYYLNCIQNGNDVDIYKIFDIFKVTDNPNVTMSEVFRIYREGFGYSFNQLSRMSGFSKGYIANRNKAGNFGDVNFVEKVFSSIGAPLSMGVELMIRDKIKNRQLEETITFGNISTIIKGTVLWTFRKEKVDKDSLLEVFKIICGTRDAVDKYERIKKLPLI